MTEQVLEQTTTAPPKTPTVGDLLKAVRAIGMISNPSSLTSLYRSIEVGPMGLRAVSEYGIISVYLPLNMPIPLSQPILVEYKAFNAVLNSLPASKVLQFEEELNRIKWSCGGAKGHLNHVQTDYSVPKIEPQDDTWQPDGVFGQALSLASTACQAAAVTIGMYGILLEPIGDTVEMMSCNSISLAKTVVPRNGFPDGVITVRPPVPSTLHYLLSICVGADLKVTADGIIMQGEDKDGWYYMACLPVSTKLEHDLRKIVDAFPLQEKKLRLSQMEVKKFLKRAKDLQEKKGAFVVSLEIIQGQLVLKHKSIGSGTEEYFLTDEPANPEMNYPAIDVPADMLMVPLDNVEYLVLDYVSQNTLILKRDEVWGTKKVEGKDVPFLAQPQFLYVISGGSN